MCSAQKCKVSKIVKMFDASELKPCHLVSNFVCVDGENSEYSETGISIVLCCHQGGSLTPKKERKALF